MKVIASAMDTFVFSLESVLRQKFQEEEVIDGAIASYLQAAITVDLRVEVCKTEYDVVKAIVDRRDEANELLKAIVRNDLVRHKSLAVRDSLLKVCDVLDHESERVVKLTQLTTDKGVRVSIWESKKQSHNALICFFISFVIYLINLIYSETQEEKRRKEQLFAQIEDERSKLEAIRCDLENIEVGSGVAETIPKEIPETTIAEEQLVKKDDVNPTVPASPIVLPTILQEKLPVEILNESRVQNEPVLKHSEKLQEKAGVVGVKQQLDEPESSTGQKDAKVDNETDVDSKPKVDNLEQVKQREQVRQKQISDARGVLRGFMNNDYPIEINGTTYTNADKLPVALLGVAASKIKADKLDGELFVKQLTYCIGEQKDFNDGNCREIIEYYIDFQQNTKVKFQDLLRQLMQNQQEMTSDVKTMVAEVINDKKCLNNLNKLLLDVKKRYEAAMEKFYVSCDLLSQSEIEYVTLVIERSECVEALAKIDKQIQHLKCEIAAIEKNTVDALATSQNDGNYQSMLQDLSKSLIMVTTKHDRQQIKHRQLSDKIDKITISHDRQSSVDSAVNARLLGNKLLLLEKELKKFAALEQKIIDLHRDIERCDTNSVSAKNDISFCLQLHETCKALEEIANRYPNTTADMFIADKVVASPECSLEAIF